MKRFIATALVAACTLLSGHAAAQNYPAKPVRMIVAFPPGGQVSLTIDSLAQALPYIKAGRLRALAVTGAKRASMLPEVPTVAESGVPGYELTNWFGLVTRAGTPREITNRVNADVIKVLKMPDVRERLLGMALDPVGDTPDQFGAYVKSETAKWTRVIKEAGITAE